jgi:hypothetical protein
VTEMIERDLVFERGFIEDLTPVGEIIYHYRKILVDDE